MKQNRKKISFFGFFIRRLIATAAVAAIMMYVCSALIDDGFYGKAVLMCEDRINNDIGYLANKMYYGGENKRDVAIWTAANHSSRFTPSQPLELSTIKVDTASFCAVYDMDTEEELYFPDGTCTLEIYGDDHDGLGQFDEDYVPPTLLSCPAEAFEEVVREAEKCRSEHHGANIDVVYDDIYLDNDGGFYPGKVRLCGGDWDARYTLSEIDLTPPNADELTCLSSSEGFDVSVGALPTDKQKQLINEAFLPGAYYPAGDIPMIPYTAVYSGRSEHKAACAQTWLIKTGDGSFAFKMLFSCDYSQGFRTIIIGTSVMVGIVCLILSLILAKIAKKKYDSALAETVSDEETSQALIKRTQLPLDVITGAAEGVKSAGDSRGELILKNVDILKDIIAGKPSDGVDTEES